MGDNKQFVAESQQFFGIKCGNFCYESRKWALSEDPAFTMQKGESLENIYEKWMDIALVVGISIINRLLNPSLPDTKRINSIHRQSIFDVSDLLPPFDDFKSLIKNDELWWSELQKRVDREDRFASDSEYDGSLKEFVDDKDANKNALDVGNVDFKMNINQNVNACGMMNEFLAKIKEIDDYDEDKDDDYNVNEGNGDDDCEEDEDYVDQTFEEDMKGFEDGKNDKSIKTERENVNSKKRKIEEVLNDKDDGKELSSDLQFAMPSPSK